VGITTVEYGEDLMRSTHGLRPCYSLLSAKLGSFLNSACVQASRSSSSSRSTLVFSRQRTNLQAAQPWAPPFIRSQAACLNWLGTGRLWSAKANITYAQQRKTSEIPTATPINQNPDHGHSAQSKIPSPPADAPILRKTQLIFPQFTTI